MLFRSNSTVNSDNTARALTVNSNNNGTTTFNGTVGGTSALASLTTNADGTTDLNANVTTVSTTGDQVYNDAVILTTNRPFKEWNEVFPNAACIVTLLDRLLHHADVTKIEGDSYRVRESELETAARRK